MQGCGSCLVQPPRSKPVSPACRRPQQAAGRTPSPGGPRSSRAAPPDLGASRLELPVQRKHDRGEWRCREHSAVSGHSPSYCIRSCQEGAPRPPQHHAAPMGTGRSLQRPCLGVMSPNPTCSCRSPVRKHRSVLLPGGKGAPAHSVPSLPGAPSSPASTRCCRSPLLGSRGHGAARSCAAGQGLVGLLQAEGTSPSDRLASRTAIDQVRIQSWAAPL